MQNQSSHNKNMKHGIHQMHKGAIIVAGTLFTLIVLGMITFVLLKKGELTTSVPLIHTPSFLFI